MQKCPKCRSAIPVFRALLASKLISVKCSSCETLCYREHSASSFIAAHSFTVGVTASILIGVVYSVRMALIFMSSIIFILMFVYITEYLTISLKVYSEKEKVLDNKIGEKKLIYFLLFMLLAVGTYFIR